MSKKNFKPDYLLPAVKWGLMACLFMPLLTSGQFIFPFIFPKQTFFQILVEVLLVMYIFLALRSPKYRPNFSSWLFRAAVVYSLFTAVSAVLGVNAYHSFWSNYERMAGVIAIWHYLVFFFITFNVFKTKEEWLQFFNVSVMVSVLEAFYGIGQSLGIQSLQHGSGARIDGTIGNAAFLAGYMLINALFALWLMLEKKNASWRIFYGGVILLDLFALFQTETRGAVLALGASLIALAVFAIFAPKNSLTALPFKKPEKLKIYASIMLVAVILAAVGIYVFRDSKLIASSPALSRVANISLTEATSQTRLMAWKMSLEGFKDRPIFGWGPENYYVVFNKYYNPDLYPVESWFDRSHNAYLDVLVNTGIVGFLAYCWMFVLAFWFLFKAHKNGKINYPTLAIFVVILLAYGIQNVFLFDTQVTLLMIFSILSFIVWVGLSDRVQESGGEPLRTNYFFKFLVIAATFLLVYLINLKPASLNAQGINALISYQQGKIEESVKGFRDIYDQGGYGLPEVAMRTQSIALSLVGNSEASQSNKEAFTVLAVNGMEKSLELEPLNVRFMMMLSGIYLTSADVDPSFVTQADLTLQKALELSPTRPELYYYIGQLRLLQNRPQEGLAAFKKAVDLNDKVALSHWNYGSIAIGYGQKELGEEEIEKAYNLGYVLDKQNASQLINAYAKINEWQKIVAIYTQLIAGSSDDASLYTSLAAAYQQAGDRQNAKEAALQAARIDPRAQAQVDEFIQGLGM